MSSSNPKGIQESFYNLPYHWFPEDRLKEFERKEKQRIIFEIIENYSIKPLKKYLDVGCGDGRWTSDIYNYLDRNVNTFGTDFSKRAINFANLITPEIEFKNHVGEDLPYADNTFDLCTSIEVIEHVEDGNEEVFLQECSRVMKPSGLFILTTPSWNLQLTEHHYRHYTVERIKRLISANGFDVLSIRGQSLPCYGVKRRIRRIMSRNSKIWKFWKYTYKEVSQYKALNLIIAAKPINK
ncbi:MAG: class I SAM-dependent methyltransferase [Candidatus Marinimicrobia bacterium]|jgi:ubiquinone/menaquinone biosynthesis C-methylase UbiE|nr:class I SAM-dependent methyltransferase [Candidatus Neomarinimicrobiota bacterium]MBT3960805.1 class I SAM-dependent methyltransferase [Candidatus Neomarinimicrobiota bacterium]MBT4634992.1 class I SAM-dependent methyltransferase [Candidatus Neomarinimicrobiota bacterium]MBT4684270.1 class I SAM-dependent methyltransferase [Candidatus Neomarinimicrobiota bacterium]MBT4735487.1 class I SAM-dependent methyltransferase [Candidatus Neomarinimicrobiota bacterium]